MIASLRGKITAKNLDNLILEIDGIGYEIFLSAKDLNTANIKAEASLYIFEYIREDAHILYGFVDPEAKHFFTKLLQVNGVGPKAAMAILSASSLDKLDQAISSGNADLFKAISGIGQKTAQRIIVDLRGKLDDITKPGLEDDSAYQALVRLGYPAAVAAKAVTAVPGTIVDEQTRIKRALKEAAR